MEQRIIDNTCLILEINEYLTKQNHTQESFSTYCISKDVCIGIITKIKTSPYYFNKTGKKLMYLFIDIDTKQTHYVAKNGKKVNLNIDKNKIEWGTD
jgi:hypothetical protein